MGQRQGSNTLCHSASVQHLFALYGFQPRRHLFLEDRKLDRATTNDQKSLSANNIANAVPTKPIAHQGHAQGKSIGKLSFYTTYKIFSASHRAYRAKSCWSPYTQRSLDLGRTGDTRMAFGLYAEEPDPQKSEVFGKSVTEI